MTTVAEAGAAGASAVICVEAAEDNSEAKPEVKALCARVVCTVESAAEEVAGEASLTGKLIVYSTALSVEANSRFALILLSILLPFVSRGEEGVARNMFDKCRTLVVVLLIFVMTILSASKGGLNNFAINILNLICVLASKVKAETLMPRNTWTAGTATTTCKAADGRNVG